MKQKLSHQASSGDNLSIHSAVFLFGLAGLFGKLLTISPLLIVAGRTFCAAVTIGMLRLWQKAHTNDIYPHPNFKLLFLGALLALHWVTFFQAIQVSTVAIGLLTYASYPLFVAIIASYQAKRLPDRLTLLALLAVIIGLVLIVPNFTFRNPVSRGIFWGLISGLTFAVLTLFNRHFVNHTSPLVITGWENAGAFLVLLPLTWRLIPSVTLPQLGLILCLGLFCTALAHYLFVRGLRTVQPQNAAIIATLEPVYGIILSALLLKETITFPIIGGGIFILAGSLLATFEQLRPPV